MIKIDRTIYETKVKKRVRKRKEVNSNILHICKVCNREVICKHLVCPHWGRFVCIPCRATGER